MTSRVYGMVLGVGAVGVLIGALLFGLRPQAQEAEESQVDEVSASELELYIDVYTSMQADHDLMLDTALAQKGTSLEQFRNIERRVQKQERLIRKVRDALQAQAKARTDALAPPAARAEAPAAKPAP
jgi:GTP cyclohydrolase I